MTKIRERGKRIEEGARDLGRDLDDLVREAADGLAAEVEERADLKPAPGYVRILIWTVSAAIVIGVLSLIFG